LDKPEALEQISINCAEAYFRFNDPHWQAETKGRYMDELAEKEPAPETDGEDTVRLGPLCDQLKVQEMPKERSLAYRIFSKVYYKLCPPFLRPLLMNVKAKLLKERG
jgi:hypothetical protein